MVTKRRFSLAVIIFFMMLCQQATARDRSEQQMLNAAANVLDRQALSRGQRRGNTARTLRIVHRSESFAVVQADGGGFALVSSDDRHRPLLGYSREGHYNPADLPCGLKWYMQALEESLRNTGINGYDWTPIGIAPMEGVEPSVEPLLQSDWYQRTPFNDWCPTYEDENGNLQHHSVGCGPTAVMQVMFYHRHPAVGRGEVTYEYDPKQVFYETSPSESNLVTLSCRFDTVRFDWDNMLAHYANKRSTDETANEAVARLAMAVGIAMKVAYTETSGSGSGPSDVWRALRDHFGYAPSVRRIFRSNYADSTWMRIVFEELSNGRPVIYRGKPAENAIGHIFVVDGYDTDGLVHINWGYGNNERYDGYFDINYLRPNHWNRHYSELQTMVVDIRPEDVPTELDELSVSVPGSLAGMLPSCRSLRLKLRGTLDSSDLQVLHQLGCGIKDTANCIVTEITHLDLSEASLPGDVLPDNAFDGCTSLLDVVLPSSLKGIGDMSFHNCSSLVHVGMPSGLRTIGKLAFQNCTRLAGIVIPQGVDAIGDAAFSACTSNDSFAVESGNRHFSAVSGMLTNAAGNKLVAFPAKRATAELPSSIDSIGKYAFRYCINLKELHIPGSVHVVGEYAFMNCSNVAKVTLDEGVRVIANYAFNRCYSLTEVRLPASLTTIGQAVFVNCTGLHQVDVSEASALFRCDDNMLFSKDGTQILQQFTDDKEEYVVPPTVTSIAAGCFRNKNNLRRLTIPESVKSIGNNILYDSKGLTDVVALAVLPVPIGANVFSHVDLAPVTLRVPAGTAPLYRRTLHWRKFERIEELEGENHPLPYLVMPSWQGGAPFDAQSPVYEGQHLPVGSGTVATSQLLGYYRRPSHGFGQVHYTSLRQGITTDVDADFEAHPFDWENILDVYDGNATTQQQAAVANLFSMVGAAIHTQYGSTNSTIVNWGAWLAGMTRYLHFAPTARYRYRKYYSTAEWTRMIEQQLAAGHPVIYNSRHTGPFGSNSEHIFILDGQEAQGDYHFNFGYDNSSADKFTTLNAINQGSEPKAGNRFTCWHHCQAMITDCYPVEGLADSDYPRCEASLFEPFELENDPSASEVSVSGRLRAKFRYRCISFYADSIHYTLGFFRDGQLAGVSPSWRQNNFGNGGGTSRVDRYFTLPDGLPDGDYEMALVTRTDADAPWLRSWDNAPNGVPVTVKGRVFCFHMPNLHCGPTFLRLEGELKEVAGTRQDGHTFEFAIHNPSDNNFEDSIRVSIVSANGKVYDSYMPTSVYDGQTLSYSYFIPDSRADFSADFSVALYYRETSIGEWVPLAGKASEAAVAHSLAKGWNWVSVPFSDGDKGVDARSFLQPIEERVERMMSQTNELVNDEQWGLVGSLTTLTPQHGYRVKVSEDVSFSYDGSACSPQLFPVTLRRGWNWLGYVPDKPMTLEDALSALAPADNDCISGHDDFAIYSDGHWSGSLQRMVPGESYLYHASAQQSFRYPSIGALSRGHASQQEAEAPVPPLSLPASWTYDVHAHPDVTTFIARLQTACPSDFAVAAFCNGVCRGVAKVVGGLLFLTVHGTLGMNEAVTLQAYDSSTGQVVPIAEHFGFDGRLWGTLQQPVGLTLCSGITEVGSIKADGTENVAYTIDGRRLRRLPAGASLRQGFYIIRDKEGKWKKKP